MHMHELQDNWLMIGWFFCDDSPAVMYCMHKRRKQAEMGGGGYHFLDYEPHPAPLTKHAFFILIFFFFYQ